MEVIIFFIIIIFLIYICSSNIYIKSYSDNIYYKVQRNINQYKSVKYLSYLRNTAYNLVSNLNINNNIYIKYKDRFIKLKNMIKTISINEKPLLDSNTSYTINKGEEMILCLKSKKTNKFHDINDIIYILIHELSHIVCPEKGHTEFFYNINKFLLNEAIQLKIYKKINYKLNPIEYCGIELNEYLL